jgi:outer membrane protein, multidrug efflux system
MKGIQRRHLRFAGIILLIASVLGCAKSTQVVKPDSHLPAQYITASDSVSIAHQRWNTFFQDTCLVALIEKALVDNFQVKKMMQQITVAHASLRVARGGLLPEVSGNTGAFKRKFGTYTMDGVGNDDTNANPGLPEDKRIPTPYQEFTLGGAFSWELDVWGKLNNQRRAAKARWLATQEEQHALTTWLVAEVATLYYELEGLDKEKEALIRNLELQE